MKATHRILIVLALLFQLRSSVDAQRLWVVDAFPGPADFTSAQEAIDAAADGDTVLLMPGRHTGINSAPLVIRGKSLTLMADRRGTADIVWGFVRGNLIEVLDLEPGQRVVLRNLFIGSILSTNNPIYDYWGTGGYVRIQNCLGSVLLEDCRIAGGNPASVKVVDSSSVTLVRCDLDGSFRASDSFVSIYDSTLDGTPGVSSRDPGWEGCRLKGGELLLQGTRITGGAGWSNNSSNGLCERGRGGLGLVLHSGALPPQARVLESTILGGAWGVDPDCSVRAPALATRVTAGNLSTLPGLARSTWAGALVHEGSEVQLRFDGVPGDLLRATSSSGLAGFQYPAFIGHGILAFPLSLFLQRTLATGSLTRLYPMNNAGAGAQASTYFVQSVFTEPGGSSYLSSPSSLVLADLRDPAFGQDCDGDGTNDLWQILGEGAADYDLDGVLASCESHPILYVDDDATGDPGPGDPTISDPLEDGSADHPFDAIQEAMDATSATTYSIVELLDGIYTGVGNRDIDFKGKDLVLRSRNGAAACIIDCEKAATGFQLTSGESPRCRLEGLTVRNARKKSFAGGAAVYIDRSHPTIVDCIFRNNQATGFGSGRSGGGAICATGSVSRVRGCQFYRNTVTGGGGGGLYMKFDGGVALPEWKIATPSVVDCTFDRNTGGSGGGCYLSGWNGAIVERCLFQDNVAAWGDGGGLWTSGAQRISDSLFFGNTAMTSGGGLYARSAAQAEILGCTLAGNVVQDGARGSGGGATVQGVSLKNSILWGNSVVGSGIGKELSTLGTVPVEFCVVQGGLASVAVIVPGFVWGPGNLETDPEFVDPLSEDYRLLASSPCIDAGDPRWYPGLFQLDLDGSRRSRGAVDMGAYETRTP